MKKIFTIVMVLGTFSFALSQTKTTAGPSSDEQAVIQLERERANAFVQGDIRTLERIFANELTHTFDGGFISTKEGVLQNLRPMPGMTADLSDLNARVYGNAAVVTGVVVFKPQNGEADYFRFTDTFVKQQKGWQLIAAQQQRISSWVARGFRDELKTLAAHNCSEESSLRSVSSDVPTYIRFNNTTVQPVVVHWINYEGQRDPSENQKLKIGAGQSGFLYTYLTHPFLVADANGKCLAIYQPAREPSLAIIR